MSQSQTAIKCERERCYSPIACTGFGYCRDLNFGDYDPQKDFAGSLNEGYAAIRQRVAAGGPGWERE